MAASIKRFWTLSVTSIVLGVALLTGATQANAAEETNQNQNQIQAEDVQRFSAAINDIKNYYVTATDDKKLFDDAIRGMLSGLDPHSDYLNEEDFKELQEATSGEFGGLGIEVTMENGVIKVIAPLDGTPAQKAGIKSGDYIVRLGKTPISGLTLRDAVTMMRGKAGSKIVLTVVRKGQSKLLTFDLIRSNIQVKSVKSELLDKNYGYVRLSQFQELTAADMIKAIKKLQQQAAGGKLKGLVLDLRNNPGGLLDSAIQTADAFIDSKTQIIVYTKGRIAGSKFTAIATPGDVLNKAPMVVLINSGSASGSEIVAGALKDTHRAVLVGTRSFGKGSVQTVMPLDSKTGIKLTTALYYTPSGVSIQAKGIMPDITVEEITIPSEKSSVPNPNDLSEFSEADLNGHLANGNKTADSEKINTESDKINPKDLIYKDYQLFEALNVLKAMAVANNSSK